MMHIQVGDVVELKKPHACGNNAWTVRRTGIEIRLCCNGCGQDLWMSRRDFEKRFRRIRRDQNQ